MITGILRGMPRSDSPHRIVGPDSAADLPHHLVGHVAHDPVNGHTQAADRQLGNPANGPIPLLDEIPPVGGVLRHGLISAVVIGQQEPLVGDERGGTPLSEPHNGPSGTPKSLGISLHAEFPHNSLPAFELGREPHALIRTQMLDGDSRHQNKQPDAPHRSNSPQHRS